MTAPTRTTLQKLLSRFPFGVTLFAVALSITGSDVPKKRCGQNG